MTLASFFPYSVWDCAWLAPATFVLDFIFGDPRLPWPHPVCFIGRFLHKCEPWCRKWAAHRRLRLEFAGAATLIITAGSVFILVAMLVEIPWIGVLVALYLAWGGLAFGCLLKTGREVLERVETCDLPTAREGVSWLVSRDVSELDRPMLRKTLADTLSENFTDAFTAPFFWLVLTGPAGLWAYKAVSTMDSQWGYLTPQWLWLGRAGARCDDMLAFVPARISALAFYAANALARLFRCRKWSGNWPGLRIVARDAHGMPSPNSGWSMAACAWLADGRMAGPSVYFGRLVVKPWLGPSHAAPWNRQKLTSLLGLLAAASVPCGLLIWLTGICMKWFGEFLLRALYALF